MTARLSVDSSVGYSLATSSSFSESQMLHKFQDKFRRHPCLERGLNWDNSFKEVKTETTYREFHWYKLRMMYKRGVFALFLLTALPCLIPLINGIWIKTLFNVLSFLPPLAGTSCVVTLTTPDNVIVLLCTDELPWILDVKCFTISWIAYLFVGMYPESTWWWWRPRVD